VKFATTRWLLAQAFILCAATHAHAQERTNLNRQDAYLPTQFTLYLGGLFGPSYTVELAGHSLTYRTRSWNPEIKAVAETSKRITPSENQWRQFWKAADTSDLWRWQREYIDPSTRDGTQWHVSITLADKTINSRGSNAYPPQFSVYTLAVKGLLGGEEFR
jgi:hypothetical protein